VVSSDTPVNYVELATQTEGFSAADLTDLVTRAFHQVVIRALSDHSTKVCDQVYVRKRCSRSTRTLSWNLPIKILS
jgi:hypothetical protein